MEGSFMSDETEALAAGVKATVEAALAPVTDIIRKLAGPAAEELGLTFRDHVRVVRFERQVRLWNRVKEMVEKTGIPPHKIPLKLLGPVIQNAELEEDDALQDRWAALLANAATDRAKVHPAFIDTLRQLSPQDAQLLDRISQPTAPDGSVIPFTFGVRSGNVSQFDLPSDETQMSLENFKRLGLIGADSITINSAPPRHWITTFGLEFIRACRQPKSA
jgi:hypothetical protein